MAETEVKFAERRWQ